MVISNVDNETLLKRFSSDLCDEPPKRYVAYEIFKKNAIIFSSQAKFSNFRLFKKNRLHAHLLAFSEQFLACISC